MTKIFVIGLRPLKISKGNENETPKERERVEKKNLEQRERRLQTRKKAKKRKKRAVEGAKKKETIQK